MSLSKQFIESIKVENQQPFLLKYHQRRVEETFSHFIKKSSGISLEKIVKNIQKPKDSSTYKLRIIYDLEGNFETECIPYSTSHIENFILVEAPHLEYHFKYENREIFTELKEKSKAEEIIITQNGKITDTSFSNLIFLKNNEWFTPKTYLLNGVQRQFLLETQQIQENDISMENLHLFSHFTLINAMRTLPQCEKYPISKIIS